MQIQSLAGQSSICFWIVALHASTMFCAAHFPVAAGAAADVVCAATKLTDARRAERARKRMVDEIR
jgi:hypothetical protein